MREMRELINMMNENLANTTRVETRTVQSGDKFVNGEHTSNRHPGDGSTSWIKYWTKHTGCEKNIVKCTFCGKILYIDQSELTCNEMLIVESVLLEDAANQDKAHQAEGGHVLFPYEKKTKRYWIAPICPECNKDNASLVVTQSSTICKEVNPRIDTDK